jgi:hypothetical protein
MAKTKRAITIPNTIMVYYYLVVNHLKLNTNKGLQYSEIVVSDQLRNIKTRKVLATILLCEQFNVEFYPWL